MPEFKFLSNVNKYARKGFTGSSIRPFTKYVPVKLIVYCDAFYLDNDGPKFDLRSIFFKYTMKILFGKIRFSSVKTDSTSFQVPPKLRR